MDPRSWPWEHGGSWFLTSGAWWILDPDKLSGGSWILASGVVVSCYIAPPLLWASTCHDHARGHNLAGMVHVLAELLRGLWYTALNPLLACCHELSLEPAADLLSRAQMHLGLGCDGWVDPHSAGQSQLLSQVRGCIGYTFPVLYWLHISCAVLVTNFLGCIAHTFPVLYCSHISWAVLVTHFLCCIGHTFPVLYWSHISWAVLLTHFLSCIAHTFPVLYCSHICIAHILP